MKVAAPFELSGELKKSMAKARRLEWITVGYLVSVIVLMYIVMGSSQAMKTAWLEDALSMLPSIAFLIATAIYDRAPNRRFPYGYHRVFSIAFLAGSMALFGMGLFLIFDSASSLFKMEHPTIGMQQIGGRSVWMGWIMLLALVYSSVPAVILGYKKQPLARHLHNKILHTDADGQKADYRTAFAAMIGITLVGFGFWWADSVAAILIALSVVKDGAVNLKTAVFDLMDRRPLLVNGEKEDPLINQIEQEVLTWEWVDQAEVRFREHGQVYFGEITVVPQATVHSLEKKVEEGVQLIKSLDWKIYDVSLTPAQAIDNFPADK